MYAVVYDVELKFGLLFKHAHLFHLLKSYITHLTLKKNGKEIEIAEKIYFTLLNHPKPCNLSKCSK